ncbi:hypothetical protein A9W96_16410 [Mycobacterium sp. 1245852.3]|nr:hypothetical protein A9W96_16410 [Mycobacterium sp. 1245852.3]
MHKELQPWDQFARIAVPCGTGGLTTRGRVGPKMLSASVAWPTRPVCSWITYADLFDDDLDAVAVNLDAPIAAARDRTGTEPKSGTAGLRPKSR